jgi:hypothetical protein
MVPNMPDLGATPAFLGDVALSALSSAFNDNLRLALTALDAALPSAEIVQFDTAAAFRDILDNSAAYGLTNTRTACIADPACNPDTWLFWDGVHPTTATDRILAAKFRAAIPEPTTTALFAGGLLSILALRWRALAVKSRTVAVRQPESDGATLNHSGARPTEHRRHERKHRPHLSQQSLLEEPCGVSGDGFHRLAGRSDQLPRNAAQPRRTCRTAAKARHDAR